jgi:23S rRNA pseudouridine2605 synthase
MRKPERIAKRMAAAGLCSRREAERWIEAGRVVVNGVQLDSPAHTVTLADEIIVDGIPLPQQAPTQVWLYHKPVGVVTTARDPQGRPTVFEQLPADLPRVVTVGRLDLNSEGLLLLTNDGELAEQLMHPRNELPRTYKVRAHGALPADLGARLAQGVTIEGIRYRPMTSKIQAGTGQNHWLELTLHEGKNREIRKVLNHFGLQVNRLIRTSYGPFHLAKLAAGAVVTAPSAKLAALQGQLK